MLKFVYNLKIQKAVSLLIPCDNNFIAGFAKIIMHVLSRYDNLNQFTIA